MTLKEFIEAFDNGKPVSSLEMGGLGPGYEQAIQLAAIEFARAGMGLKEKPTEEEWSALCSKELERIDESLLGLTGAQYSAANWLAFHWCFRGGPDGVLREAKERKEDSRCILISKYWPKVN